MAERGERPGFALEPLLQGRISGDVRREDFDGDRTVEPRVARAIDFAHPARAEERDNLIRPESSAGRESHVLWWRDYTVNIRGARARSAGVRSFQGACAAAVSSSIRLRQVRQGRS